MSDPFTDEEIAELRKLEKGATPGPWVAQVASVHHSHGEHPPQAEVTRPADESEAIAAGFTPGHDWKKICSNHDRKKSNCVAGCYMTRGKLQLEMANAELIAASRNVLPRLLDRVARLQQENQALRGGCSATAVDMMMKLKDMDATK